MKLLSYHCNLYTDISKNQSVETMSTYLSKFKSNEKKKKKQMIFFQLYKTVLTLLLLIWLWVFFTCVNSVILWLNLMNNNKISDFMNGMYWCLQAGFEGKST